MRINDSAKVELYKKDFELNKSKKNTKENGNDKVINDGKINGNDKIINDGKVNGNDKPTNDTNTEEKLNVPEDRMDISILKAEADKAYAHLRRIVEDLLERQGINIERLSDPELKPEDIEVDQQARDEAKQMVEEGGPLSAESVSTRIVDFAKAISDGNLEKFDLLKGAIEDGFEAAKGMFGEEMPEITQETYNLVMEKLDAWQNGTEGETDVTNEETVTEESNVVSDETTTE